MSFLLFIAIFTNNILVATIDDNWNFNQKISLFVNEKVWLENGIKVICTFHNNTSILNKYLQSSH